jgi:hypothetical protein
MSPLCTACNVLLSSLQLLKNMHGASAAGCITPNVCSEIGELPSFSYLVASAVLFTPGDVIFAQQICPQNDVIFCLHWEWPTYNSTNIDNTNGFCYKCYRLHGT